MEIDPLLYPEQTSAQGLEAKYPKALFCTRLFGIIASTSMLIPHIIYSLSPNCNYFPRANNLGFINLTVSIVYFIGTVGIMKFYNFKNQKNDNRRLHYSLLFYFTTITLASIYFLVYTHSRCNN